MLTQGKGIERLILDPILYVTPANTGYTLLPKPASADDVFTTTSEKPPSEGRPKNEQ